MIDLTMYLTANRRMTFAASRRFSRDQWTPDENERLYGAGAEGAWGSGENFEAHFVLDGELDPSTGMFVNLAWVKEALNLVLEQRYDHRCLNLDTPPFDTAPPTAENLASELLGEATRACAHLAARPVVCHLDESAGTGATFYLSGPVERDFWMSFSAARRTWSPHLSEAENLERFGRAASPAGHGHGYRLRATLAGPADHGSGLIVPHETSSRALAALHALLDHRNLNVEVADLAGSPMTTECLARFIFRRLAGRLDERSGTLFHLGRFEEAVESTLGAWNGRHLDLEVEEFHESPSTGENILRALWPRLDSSLDGMLVRLRLFETENNRFTLRLQATAPTRS